MALNGKKKKNLFIQTRFNEIESQLLFVTYRQRRSKHPILIILHYLYSRVNDYRLAFTKALILWDSFITNDQRKLLHLHAIK